MGHAMLGFHAYVNLTCMWAFSSKCLTNRAICMESWLSFTRQTFATFPCLANRVVTETASAACFLYSFGKRSFVSAVLVQPGTLRFTPHRTASAADRCFPSWERGFQVISNFILNQKKSGTIGSLINSGGPVSTHSGKWNAGDAHQNQKTEHLFTKDVDLRTCCKPPLGLI